ncbi:MAG: hypothetical protein K0S46_2438 [Moraxellaceae bacterium]|jgi:hypothetical protein|nr:hypothetical protein [Moraxellaceae bacterium]
MDDLDYQLKLPSGIDTAIRFLVDSSRAFGHNRHRALIARRLKHVPLSPEQADVVVEGILKKLREGDIDEQFMDQLRLCHHLSPERTRAVATELLGAEKEYIRRYAGRVLRINARP